MAFIAYKITHRESGKAYIGITTRSLEVRWKAHVTQAPHKKMYIAHAIVKYGSEAFDVQHIASSFNKEALMKLERILIEQHGTKYPAGFNLTAGGEGFFDPPEESRVALSNALKGRIFSVQHKIKIGTASRSRAPEVWVRIADKLRGKKTGRVPSSQAIEAFRNLNVQRTGIPLTDSHRANISKAQIGSKRDPSVGAKISASKLGKPRSDDTKAKLRAYWRGREEDIYIPEPLATEIMQWLGRV